MSIQDFQNLPASESCRIIDFNKAEVISGIVNGTFFLDVGGTAMCQNMEVALVPRVYNQQPEYWAIEVTGCLPGGICLEAIKEYSLLIPLAGIVGTKGIEVVGARNSEKFDI